MAVPPPPGAPAGAAEDDRGPLRAAFGGLTTRGRSFLAAGAAAAVCAYLLGQPDLLRVGLLLAALPVVCVLVLHRTRSRVTAARRLSPARVPAGVETRVHLALENVARVPTGLLLLQDRLPYVLGARPRFVLDRVEPGGRREVSYRLRADQRGRYPLGPLQLRLADPFGMAELNRSFRAHDTLTVLPRIEELPAVRLAGPAGGDGDGRRRGLAVAGDEDVIPREYRYGDDLRRVHWRSTAHRGVLMVRREEPPARAGCTVLLDTRRGGYVGWGPGSPFEQAVSGAASAVAHLAARGYPVRLVTDTGLLLPGPGSDTADAAERTGLIMDALAVVDHSAGTTFDGAEAALAAGARGLLVAFTGTVDREQAALLGRLRQRVGAAAAFVAAGQLDPALEEERLRWLREAGWVALGHHPAVGLPQLWRQAAAELAVPGRVAP